MINGMVKRSSSPIEVEQQNSQYICKTMFKIDETTFHVEYDQGSVHQALVKYCQFGFLFRTPSDGIILLPNYVEPEVP